MLFRSPPPPHFKPTRLRTVSRAPADLAIGFVTPLLRHDPAQRPRRDETFLPHDSSPGTTLRRKDKGHNDAFNPLPSTIVDSLGQVVLLERLQLRHSSPRSSHGAQASRPLHSRPLSAYLLSLPPADRPPADPYRPSTSIATPSPGPIAPSASWLQGSRIRLMRFSPHSPSRVSLPSQPR